MGALGNILKFLLTKPLMTAGVAAAGDFAFNQGTLTKGAVESIISPIFSGATGAAQNALESVTHSLTDGSITEWVKTHKETAIGGALLAGFLGFLGPQGRTLALWSTLAIAGLMTYQSGVLGSFNLASLGIGNKGPAAAPAPVKQRLSSSFVFPSMEMAMDH